MSKVILKSQFEMLNLIKLVETIQPQWNRYNMGKGADKFSEVELKNLTTALEVYKEKGGDMEYWTNGAGAPNNCIIF